MQLEKVQKELVETKDELLARIQETEANNDRQAKEIEHVRQINSQLDHQVQHAKQKSEHPEIVEEQKNLIIDLKSKVNMLDQELKLVTE